MESDTIKELISAQSFSENQVLTVNTVSINSCIKVALSQQSSSATPNLKPQLPCQENLSQTTKSSCPTSSLSQMLLPSEEISLLLKHQESQTTCSSTSSSQEIAHLSVFCSRALSMPSTADNFWPFMSTELPSKDSFSTATALINGVLNLVKLSADKQEMCSNL